MVVEAIVVPRDKFPLRRKTSCCGKEAKRGESVLVVPFRQGGNLKGQVILHRRCIAPIVEEMPLDARDYEARFKSLQQTIESSGEAFPDKRKVMRRGTE